MKIRILFAVVLGFCLTSCATSYFAISRPAVNSIRPGVTTEGDLVTLFGPSDTKWPANRGMTGLDWFRSAGPAAPGYAPVLGQFWGGLDIDVQQLSVFVSPGGRVESYTFYDSDGTIKTENTHRHTTAGVNYRK
jgi:hypothetical protein